MASYATLAQLKALIRDSSSTDDDLKTLALEAAARTIDRACGTTFPRVEDGGPAQSLTTPFGVAATDLLTDTAHGLIAGNVIRFATLTGGAGLTLTTAYYVLATGLTANDFKVAATLAGSPVDFTTDVTAGSYAVGVVPPTIIEANLLQAARYWKRREAAFGVAGSPDLGNELRLLNKLDPDVEVMLAAVVHWYPVG
jgi:hypothetical protein